MPKPVKVDDDHDEGFLIVIILSHNSINDKIVLCYEYKTH